MIEDFLVFSNEFSLADENSGILNIVVLV